MKVRTLIGRAAASLFVAAAGIVAAEVIAARRGALILESPAYPGPLELGKRERPRIHLVVLGDSTAVGVGAERIQETYPWRIAGFLADQFRVRLDVIGRSGARMFDLANEFVPKALALDPDLVLIGIGANDVVHGTSMRTVARLLDRAIKTLRGHGCHILVALGPRFDPPLLGRFLKRIIKARARTLNRTLTQVAGRNNVTIVDMPGGLGTSFADEPERYYCSDRYHPSAEGYALWAEVVKGPVGVAASIISSQPQSGRPHGDDA